MQWPWRRRSRTPVERPAEAGEQLRPELQIFPEPSPETRADMEQHVFGHVDESAGWFETFLSEPELDNLATRHIAGDLNAEQETRVRAILASGTPRQARFNLLITPQLIPIDIRLDAIRTALHQSDDPYMRIAAIVGLAGAKTVRVPDDEWPAVRDELIEATHDPIPGIRNRATVTLSGRMRGDDAPAVVRLIQEGELEGSDLDNLVATLVKLGADDAVREVLAIALERGARVPATRVWLEAWQSGGKRPEEPAPPWFGLPALGYIPNLDG